MTRALAALLLLLACACGPRAATGRFHPREEGLTLLYEDPRLPEPRRHEERLQARVMATKEEGGSLLIRVSYQTLSNRLEVLQGARRGGLALPDGRGGGLVLLPEGFPAVPAWEVRGTRHAVIGWGTREFPVGLLPRDHPRVGVWVESTAPSGQRRRAFLLPDLGEVEAFQFEGGAWGCVNRLVSRGFTDLPSRSRS